MYQPDLAGHPVGYINFASLLIRSAVIDAYQFKLAGARVDQPDDGAERKVGVGRGQRLRVKMLSVGSLAAVKFRSIPAGIANPGLDGFRRFCLVSHQRRFHHRGDEEHERYPPQGGPDHEERSSHSVVFLLQLPKKCSRKASLCQPIPAWKIPLKSLILNALTSKQVVRSSLTSRSLARGSAKLTVPTCTEVAPTA